jgi:hypothetical protein
MGGDWLNQGGFQARWMRALAGEKVFTLQGHFLMRLGVAKRAAACRMCDTPVIAGQDRVEFFVRHGWRRYKNGGSGGQIYYVHTGCMMQFLEGSQIDRHSKDQCVGCRKTFEQMNGRLPFIVSSTVMSHICDDCSKLPMYKFCSHCGLWSYKARLTRFIHDAGYLCYHCDDEMDIIGRGTSDDTVRSVKRDMVIHKKVLKGYAEAETWVNELRAVRS